MAEVLQSALAVVEERYNDFASALEQLQNPPRVYSDLTRRLAFSGDASFYQLVPKLVVEVSSLSQMVALLQLASDLAIAVTFRAAGTSLSGQAISDSVLILLSEHWQGAEVLEQGQRIWLQPGVIGAQANTLLKPYGRKIGPDPASINSCKIGGIAANNASGMCCGVKHNSYHTVSEMTLVLVDGTVLNTADADSVAAFRLSHQGLLAGLLQLSEAIHQQPALRDKIRHKYRLKNTTGYGINALVDFSDPLQMLKHLMIGSEGTLAFIADIVYHTVPDEPCRSSGLFFFRDIHSCCTAVSRLASLPVAAVELMDERALLSVANKAGMPAELKQLPGGFAALLIEVAAADQQQLDAQLAEVRQGLEHSGDALCLQVDFSQDPQRNAQLWNIRKGTFPAVGSVRPQGTTVIIEDVAVPVEQLASAVAALQNLLQQHGYQDAIIFGHALDGNLHFVFSQSFDSDEEVARYAALMQQVSLLISAEYQGSLKAEHGTGRNMAPFVRQEWGDDAYGLMCQLKQLFDPDNLLNPGVLINPDAEAHLQHLKLMPAIHQSVDQCIECGFCESVCPSQGLSLSPRQRIAMQRRMQSEQLSSTQRQQLQQDYNYLGLDTCAATGLCATKCPVSINTGDFVKAMRAERQPVSGFSRWQANHWQGSSVLARFALGSAGLVRNILGPDRSSQWLKTIRQVTGERTGLLPEPFPPLAKKITVPDHDAKGDVRLVFFPSCSTRWFGPQPDAPDQRELTEVLQSVCEKAGFSLEIVAEHEKLCCGQPWSSKGHAELAEMKKQQSLRQLSAYAEPRADRTQQVILMTDASPCALQLQSTTGPKVYELTEVLLHFVLPKLRIEPADETVLLHKTCSSLRSGTADLLQQLTEQCVKTVKVPAGISCCGFAGDKGFLQPELNQHALRQLKSQVPAGCHTGYSNSRSCELGLSQHSGVPYQHVLYLLDKTSKALV